MFVRKYIAKYWHKSVDIVLNRISNDTRKIILINELQSANRTSTAKIISEQNNDIIVSLTTFGNRINDVYLAIESIGSQTMKPSKVILWLDEDVFDDRNIPITLKNLQKRGLIVDYCKDIKAYTKLIPTLKKYGQNIIITIDDDVIYNRDLIEVLYRNYLNDPDVIYCGIAKRMEIIDNTLSSYNLWEKNNDNTFIPSKTNFALGVGGVLYFPGCFHEDFLDEDRFMNLTPYADDIWYKIMSLLKGVNVKSVGNQFSKNSLLIPLEIAQEDSLSIINVVNKKNDEQLSKVFEKYNGIKLL